MNGDKFLIAEYVDKNQKNIIIKYEQGMSITAIAKLYDVAYTTIYYRLIRWGVAIRKHGGVRIPKGKKLIKRHKRRFSPELQAKLKENSRINDSKIEYISFEHSTEDQRLIDNILSHPIIG